MSISRKISILVILTLVFPFSSSCNRKDNNKIVNNVILMIGDGMGVSQIYAGLTANHGQLNITDLKQIGFIKTHSYDNYTTDSAAGGTAISSGVKTRNGMIGMNPDSSEVSSILKIAEENSLSTGLISTSSLTHATPASFIAHEVNRNMYEAIALDYLDTEVDVIIGGGKSHFCEREDGRNLLVELQNKGYSIYNSLGESMDHKSGGMAVFTADIHNPRYTEGRGDMLPDATSRAIQVLHQNSKGFFLMVEGSEIDWGGHDNDIDYVVEEVLDFDRAVKVALDFAEKDGHTLVLITADHECGGLTLNNGDLNTGAITAEFTTKGHTGVMVPVFAYGPGAEKFTGIFDNTDLFDKIINVYGFDTEQ